MNTRRVIALGVALVGATAMVGRALPMLRYGYRFALFIHQSTKPVYRLARNVSERASIHRYIARFVLARSVTVAGRVSGSSRLTAQGSRLSNVLSFCVKDTIYYIDLRAGEMFSFEEIYHDKTYEQESSFIPQAGWIVFDVGANVGVFTVQQAQRRATVYAFEPNPACLGRLRKTITANALNDRVTVLDLALGSAVGQGTLVMSDGVTCIGAVLPTETAPSNEGTAIQISSLDDIASALNVERIDLLKIDTEGAELEVLRGAHKTLQNVEHVVLEYHSVALLNQTIGLLHDHGFSLVRRHVPDASAERGVIYLGRSGLGEMGKTSD